MNDYPVPPNFQGLIRNMQKSIDRLERRPTGSTNAVVSGNGDAQMVTDGSGIALPTSPPALSPAVKAYGNATSITLVVDDPDVAQTTYLDYFIDGVLIASTQSRVVLATDDAAGLPLADDVDYTFTVQARNVAGSAAPSAPAVARLNPDVDQTTVLGWVVAGFILAGAIQVGNITIDPDSGITIPLASGGVIQFPADGSDAVIQAVLRTSDLIVNGGLTVNGTTNKTNGTMVYANIVDTPSNKPAMTVGAYPTVAASGTQRYSVGAAQVPSSNTVLVTENGGSSNLPFFNLVTGAALGSLTLPFPPALPGGFGGAGMVGLGRVGTRYYAAFVRTAASGSNVDLLPFDWNGVSTTITTYPLVNIFTSSTAVASNFVQVVFDDAFSNAYVQVGATVYKRNAATGAAVSQVTLAGRTNQVLGYVGSGPYGVLMYHSNDGLSWNSSGARSTGYDWAIPPVPGGYGGQMIWDGTSRKVLCWSNVSGSTLQVVTLSSFLVQTLYFAVSYFDSDPAGNPAGTPIGGTAGTHETLIGPAVTYTIAGGTWVRVTVPAPPDQGAVDDPDTTRLYVAVSIGGTYYKQPDFSPGVITGTFGSFVSGTKTPEGSNGFAALGSNSVQQSGAVGYWGTSPVWRMFGQGSGNMGPYQWDSTGVAVGTGNVAESVSGSIISPTSTTNLTIPCSVTIGSPGTSAAWSVWIDADVNIGTSGTVNVIELLVDGTVNATKALTTSGAATTRIRGCMHFIITGLASGAHTLTLRTRNSAASTSASIGASTTLTVLRAQ